MNGKPSLRTHARSASPTRCWRRSWCQPHQLTGFDLLLTVFHLTGIFARLFHRFSNDIDKAGHSPNSVKLNLKTILFRFRHLTSRSCCYDVVLLLLTVCFRRPLYNHLLFGTEYHLCYFKFFHTNLYVLKHYIPFGSFSDFNLLSKTRIDPQYLREFSRF